MEEGREDKEEEIGRGDPTFQSEVRPNRVKVSIIQKSLLGACITQPVLPPLALTTPGRQLLPCPRFYRHGRLRQRTHSVKATQPADGGPGT